METRHIHHLHHNHSFPCGQGDHIGLGDFVFYLTGIPAVCIKTSGCLDLAMYRLMGRVLGKEQRAEELIAYAREKISWIKARVSQIPKDKRVKVFFWGWPNRDAPRTIAPYDPIGLAGGINVAMAADIKPYEDYDVTKEQVAVWNADVILIHGGSLHTSFSIEDLLDGPALKTVSAVKSKRIYFTKVFMIGWDPGRQHHLPYGHSHRRNDRIYGGSPVHLPDHEKKTGNMAMKLSINNVVFGYNSVPVLDEISFELAPGEILSIVGPNGTEKSTLLRCMDGLIRPDKGSIFLGKENIKNMNRLQIAKILGYVPQSFDTVFPLKVLDMVLLGRYPHMLWKRSRLDLEKVYAALTLMGIEDLAMRSFNEISGGQQQKVIIARALAQEAQVLLLDEPTSNLYIMHQLTEILNFIDNNSLMGVVLDM